MTTFDVAVIVRQTQYIYHVVAWEELAEQIANEDKYFTSYAEIAINGYFRAREWTNLATGETHTRREYVVTEIM